MLYTITISIFTLIAINLVLLKFSSFKTKRSTKAIEGEEVFTPEITIERAPQELAPTGS